MSPCEAINPQGVSYLKIATKSASSSIPIPMAGAHISNQTSRLMRLSSSEKQTSQNLCPHFLFIVYILLVNYLCPRLDTRLSLTIRRGITTAVVPIRYFRHRRLTMGGSPFIYIYTPVFCHILYFVSKCQFRLSPFWRAVGG